MLRRLALAGLLVAGTIGVMAAPQAAAAAVFPAGAGMATTPGADAGVTLAHYYGGGYYQPYYYYPHHYYRSYYYPRYDNYYYYQPHYYRPHYRWWFNGY